MNGNSYALKVSPEHLPVSLNDATLLLISETLYNTMPASESYKYVGDQWETRLILMRYLQPEAGEPNENSTLRTSAVTTAISNASGFSWNSKGARMLMGLFYKNLYELKCKGTSFNYEASAEILLKCIEEYNAAVFDKQADQNCHKDYSPLKLVEDGLITSANSVDWLKTNWLSKKLVIENKLVIDLPNIYAYFHFFSFPEYIG